MNPRKLTCYSLMTEEEQNIYPVPILSRNIIFLIIIFLRRSTKENDHINQIIECEGHKIPFTL